MICSWKVQTSVAWATASTSNSSYLILAFGQWVALFQPSISAGCVHKKLQAFFKADLNAIALEIKIFPKSRSFISTIIYKLFELLVCDFKFSNSPSSNPLFEKPYTQSNLTIDTGSKSQKLSYLTTLLVLAECLDRADNFKAIVGLGQA